AVPQSGNAFGGVASELDLTLSLQVAAVPEPETWALLAAGLGLVTVASRRRARR
ncbi:MAG: PEPxxWA-CTERM sorting domain-containing protein, partial [Betaproteobacteria bacterium]|nr:PEPxxWA-CTERM sorting domain-containing protein [Betaproteobacteria bacterium]